MKFIDEYSLAKSFFCSNHSFYAVVHVLHEVLLGAAKSAFVRNVEGAVCGLGVLAVDATNLDVVFVRDSLELGHVLAEVGELDVDRGAHGGAAVGGAGSDVSEVLVVGELHNFFDFGCAAREAFEDSSNVSAGLHADDSELVLLVDPDEEGLVFVVENTTAVGPIAVEAAGLQEAVALPNDS
jgi:hypothetical protein